MATYFGSMIIVEGGRREKQVIDPLLASWAGVHNGAQLYESAVIAVLEKIRSNRVGAILLAAIDRTRSRSTQYICIRPCKAELKNMKDGTGQPVADARTYPAFGPSAIIDYDPAQFPWYCQYAQMSNDDQSYTPDNVLFHELVHAYRCATGTLRPQQLPTGYRSCMWDNTEELIAVMIANIYMSVDGVPDTRLRGSHTPNECWTKRIQRTGASANPNMFVPLGQMRQKYLEVLSRTSPADIATHPEALELPEASPSDRLFYFEFWPQIDRFRNEQDELYRPLANLLNCWNPLRERAKIPGNW